MVYEYIVAINYTSVQHRNLSPVFPIKNFYLNSPMMVSTVFLFRGWEGLQFISRKGSTFSVRAWWIKELKMFSNLFSLV
jgi:hypothetical protein